MGSGAIPAVRELWRLSEVNLPGTLHHQKHLSLRAHLSVPALVFPDPLGNFGLCWRDLLPSQDPSKAWGECIKASSTISAISSFLGKPQSAHPAAWEWGFILSHRHPVAQTWGAALSEGL